MKNSSKLEVSFAIAAVVMTMLVCLHFSPTFAGVDEPLRTQLEADSRDTLLIFLVVLSTFVLGTYFHVAWQSKFGLAAEIIAGGLLSIFFAIVFFSGAAFYYYGLGGLLLALPMIFGVLTVIFAIRNHILNFRSELN